jgi:hypothetical protein
VIVLGVGAQGTVDHGWDAIKPIERAVKDFVSAVLDRSPTIGVRGEATREYLNGLGFRDVDVIGCPSMFRWGDTINVGRKVSTLDEGSNVGITISPYRAAMGSVAMAARARYPRLSYFAQDLPTLSLLLDGTPLPGGTPEALLPVHPGHPFFREHRTRFYVDPWPWIEDLRGYDFSFGTRIHGTIAALLAGTPAVVLAHDSRTLELARYFDIPYRLLRDVQPDLDPAELYAEADFTALHARHAERFETIVQYLARNGIDHVFAHDGSALRPPLRGWPRDDCGDWLDARPLACAEVDHDRAPTCSAAEPHLARASADLVPHLPVCHQDAEQLAHRVVPLDRMAEGALHPDLVPTAVANAGPSDVAGGGQVVDDGLSRPLRDAQLGGDLPQADVGIARDHDQGMTVSGEERPARLAPLFMNHAS